MDHDNTSYEYQAGVRDKVKEIESRLQLGSLGSSSENIESAAETDSPKLQYVQISKSDSNSPKKKRSSITSDPNMSRVPEAKQVNSSADLINIGSSVADSLSKIEQLCKQKQGKPQIQTVQNNGEDEEIQQQSPPKPAPRRFVVPRNESGNHSTVSRRSSSEDDGIADMASESDPFDDSTLPLPKIRENLFYLKDRKKSSGEIDSEEEGSGNMNGKMFTGLPPLSPRRASFNPQSSYEEKEKAERPRTLRGRTDSTNSAENFVFRQISKDGDGSNRRESQAEVKINVLQSNKASTQTDSPLGSPILVRTKTLSNSTASILVLGLPQSGKSSTIASLVQKPEILEVNPSSDDIIEYTSKIKILDSSNLFSLKIIETPGYTNDHSIISDAQMMSTLISYLDDKSHGLRGKSPTIVLVVMRFDDKRLWNPEDEHPDIVSFLKLIHNFQKHLNDGKCANFVFVLTHFMGGSATEQEQRRPQTKIVELINLIQKYTSLPHPIMVCCAENEQSKSSRDKFDGSGLAVSLMNGETYPYNLIDKIKVLLTKKGRDSVGETVLRTAFGIEYPYSIKECRITRRIPLVPQSHSTVQQMSKAILHAYLDIQRTEIFTLLEIGWENIDPKIRDKFPESLYTVQQIFQTKKVSNFVDIPEDPGRILTLVRQMPSNLAVKDLLIDTLQLKVPPCYPALYVGQGFDLWKDTTTNVSPFHLASGLKTSPIGLIPNQLECKIRDDREICFKFFHSTEEFISDRLKDLNLRYSISSNSLSTMSSNSNHSNKRWGYNVIKPNQEVTKSTVATAVIEYRIFQISICSQGEIIFKEQFWETLEGIPDLDLKSSTSVTAWRDFFGYWGTHVVQSAFGGGSVELTFRGNILAKIINSMKKDMIVASDEYETSKVFQWITGDGLDFVAACGKDVKHDFLQGYDVEAHFHGGDIRYQQVDLTKLAGKEEVTNIREEWKESLVLNPVMLETNLVLVPLSYFVRQKSEGMATKIDVALHYFYSDFMTSQGKQSSCHIL